MNIPERKDVPPAHRWDLSKLFPTDSDWEAGLKTFGEMAENIDSYRGTLGESASRLKSCLDFMNRLGLLEERLGYYAHLRLSEDGGDSAGQDRYARYLQTATSAEVRAGYLKPEIQSIPDEKIHVFIEELPEYRIYLQKMLRYKPHILSENEEKLLSLQEEANQTAQKTFAALTDVDMEFGTISTSEGEKPLSHSTFQAFMVHPDRALREHAYGRYMKVFEGHKNSLAALYAGSVHLDIYTARARRFSSARTAKLFPDAVPESVYDNLISAVREYLPVLHDYYDLRRRVLGIDSLRLFDTKVPLVKDITVRHTYEEAADCVLEALEPLGEEYRETLRRGLFAGWVDRYENKGKRSGAFSAGSYAGDPYILMNYKEDLLRDVFTLAHEAGHSMHSFYSVGSNPFQHYNYTIFEAEVASTFNEQLLMQYFYDRAETPEFKAYLVGKQIDDIIATLFRQTMFAEFEHLCHSMVAAGRPLTVASLRSAYRELLVKYFGPGVAIDSLDELEGLRIPHFYRSFYVYKYATGIAAAIALARKVLKGGQEAKESYFAFLKSGGSRFPLESLKAAGVDMTEPGPVREALDLFSRRLEELKAYFP
jgi:oligoendopeptidase F